MEAYFEENKNRLAGVEYPFYIAVRGTESEGYEVPNHWHYHLELLYFSLGSAEVYVGNKRIDVSAGDLLIIHPCEVHAICVEEGGPFEHYIMAVDTGLFALMPDLLFDLKYSMGSEVSRFFRRTKISLGNNSPEHPIVRCIMDMHQEYMQRETGFELTVTACLYKVMAWLMRSQSDQLPVWPPKSIPNEQTMANFHKVLAYIDQQAHKQVTAIECARMSLMSYSHFAKVFKSVMRVPFTRYLSFVRIRKAEQLLLDPQKTIAQIAYETGFSSVSYFIKQFKSANGVSPKQYRNMLANH